MLKVVSLFTGIGGLDFGFEAAGYKTIAAVENDLTACSTLRLNRAWPVIDRDIHLVSSEEIMERGDISPGEVDVLIGGPPCQPFSKSSYWVNGDALRLNDPRAGTLTAYLRVLHDLRPRAFLLENVYGLAYKGKDEGLKYLLNGIDHINKETKSNYTISWKVLNAAHFGVPQSRERVFLIGSRDGNQFSFPEPTHYDPMKSLSLINTNLEPFRTAWDAIGDLPAYPDEPSLKVGGKWGDLLPTIPEGKNYLWHTNRGGGVSLFGWRTRYWSFLLKLAKDLPSWTIQAQPGSAVGPFHWKNRKLSVQEMCRIQTLPDGLKFECGRSAAQRMLGNAVPSLLAEVLATEIRSQLLGAKRKNHKFKLMPPIRSPFPKPESICPLPVKYEALIKDYPDHPGEKKKRTRKKSNTVPS